MEVSKEEVILHGQSSRGLTISQQPGDTERDANVPAKLLLLPKPAPVLKDRSPPYPDRAGAAVLNVR